MDGGDLGAVLDRPGLPRTTKRHIPDLLIPRRWRREFNKAVRLPSRDTIFDYFLSITDGECRFEPWTKHKIFKVVDFDSNKMKMNEVRQTRLEGCPCIGENPFPALLVW